MVSSAVRADNPEVVEARRLAIPVIPRGELLAELMRLKYGIAIAGSHGKTTTTSMIAAMLSHAGLDPTVVVGGRVGMMGGSNARLGKSDYLVVETRRERRIVSEARADSRGRHQHRPRASGPLLGPRRDPRARSRSSSARFRSTARRFCAWTTKTCSRFCRQVNRRTLTYGTSAQADLRITQFFRRAHGERVSSRISRRAIWDVSGLHVPGAHNVLNATAAVAVGLELEIPVETIREALATFSGVDRRFQVRGVGARRHRDRRLRPSSDRDSRHARGRARVPLRRMFTCCSSRIATRARRRLMDDFARAFHQADTVHVMDIYAASEAPIEGVTAEALVERIARLRPSRRRTTRAPWSAESNRS